MDPPAESEQKSNKPSKTGQSSPTLTLREERNMRNSELDYI